MSHFSPFNHYDRVRRHHDNPACSNLKEFITDVVGTLEDMQNHYLNMMETYMSDLTDKLTGAVALLAANVAAHDTSIQDAIADLKTGMAAGDTAAVSAAIDAIGAASAKVAGETSALVAAMPPVVVAAAAAAAVDPAPAAAAAAAPVTA